MGFKLFIGQAIEKLLNKAIKVNYKAVPFIANGKILELDLKRAKFTPQYIFDVGANIGQSANQYLTHFPNASIYCFEPVKTVYDELIANTQTPKIKCFNVALGDKAGQVKIYKSNSYNGIGSINGINNSDLSEIETIEVAVGKDICVDYNIPFIDLLKIDTEGYEMPVLKGLEPLLKDKVTFIFIETGFNRADHCKTHIIDLIEYLQSFGFVVSGFYNQYRIGQHKLNLSHCDLLLSNAALVAL